MHFQVHIHIQCLNHSFASIPRRFIYVRYNIQSILLYNELLLPNFVPHYRLGNSLSLAFILIKDVYSEGILSHYIKRIFQELYFSYIRYNNLFTVHFKEEFAFYEPSYWLLYTLDTTFGFTEYQRSVCLISNRMFTSFRFLSSSLVWYSPVEDLKNLLGDSLGCSFRTILRLLCHYADICVSDLLHLSIFYAATEYFY